MLTVDLFQYCPLLIKRSCSISCHAWKQTKPVEKQFNAAPECDEDLKKLTGFSCCRSDPVPSVSLEMHEQTMKGMRETEDVNTHHLLQQHLYKGRKQVSFQSYCHTSTAVKVLQPPLTYYSLQHRHRYSRSHFDVNRDENEVQEIFQRTMSRRLESFKSAKMGVTPPKPITKHPKKDQQQKVRAALCLTLTRRYTVARRAG